MKMLKMKLCLRNIMNSTSFWIKMIVNMLKVSEKHLITSLFKINKKSNKRQMAISNKIWTHKFNYLIKQWKLKVREASVRKGVMTK